MTLAKELKSSLESLPYTKGYNFSIMEDSEKVVLQGVVKSFYHKQMAQEHASKFIRNRQKKLNVVNNIVVKK